MHARAADGYYGDAVVLAPRNVILWNEWALLQRDLLQDEVEACRLLEHSLELDPEFEWTVGLYAETCPAVSS